MERDIKGKLKFSYPRTMLIGLAFFAISLFWQAYMYVVPLMLGQYIQSDWGFIKKNTVINSILMLDNILAIVLLPIIGALSDKTKTPIGKRMPYILLFTFGAAICFSMVAVGDKLASLGFILTFLILSVIFMSGFRSPAVALMPDLTPKPLRSKGNAVINIMGVIGGIIGTIVLANLFVKSEASGFDAKGNVTYSYGGTNPLFFILTSAIMVAAIVALFFTIKENKIKAQVDKECEQAGYDEKAEEEKEQAELASMGAMDKGKKRSLFLILTSIFLWFVGYTAITANASRYGYNEWGTNQVPLALTIAQAAAFLAAIPAGILAGKIGRKWTICIGIGVLAISFSVLATFSGYSPAMFLFFGLIGVGWIVINVNSYPMIVQLAKGPDIGKFTGYYYFFSMSAQLVSKLVSGILMDNLSYKVLFPFSAIFVALSFVTMLFVRHGNAEKSVKAA